MNFKIGDKVRIPTQKTNKGGDSFEKFKKSILDYKLDYLVIKDFRDSGNENQVVLRRADGVHLPPNVFTLKDIVPYTRIIGYVLKDPKFKEPSEKLVAEPHEEDYEMKLFNYEKYNIDVHFTDDSYAAKELGKLGVLDLWFDAVYEPEPVVQETVLVGNPVREVVINSKGQIRVLGREFTIEHVKSLGNKFGHTSPVNSFDVIVESVWFGCRSEGTELKGADIIKLTETYNKLNKQ